MYTSEKPVSRVSGLCKRSIALLIAAALPAAALAEAETYTRIESGHSAMWYDPERSGEGWVLEILPDDGAVLYWFTFDDEGNPRWLGGAGQITRSEEGDTLHFAELYSVRGPRFGDDYDPASAVRQNVGSATFRFHDCNSGEISFDAYGWQDQYSLTRLTRVMGTTGCSPAHGIPGEPVQAYAGQSGSWYDPDFSGQGFTLSWLADGSAGLVWFTFDAEGNPFWMTGIGYPKEDEIVFPELVSVRGGRFGPHFNPAEVIRTSWGRMELELDCNSGEASFHPTVPGFSSGEFDLTRLTRLASPACPWVGPGKLTDLYEVSLTSLPVPVTVAPPQTGSGSGNVVRGVSVADNGTVLGNRRQYHDGVAQDWLVQWRSGDTGWEEVLDGINATAVQLAADGAKMLVNLPDIRRVALIWGRNLAIHSPEGPSGHMMAMGASDDLAHVFGRTLITLEDGSTRNWYWQRENGGSLITPLPAGDGRSPMLVPKCISNDGQVVMGVDRELELGNQQALAVRSVNAGRAQYLTDALGDRLVGMSACSKDGRIAYGYVPLRDGEAGTGQWLPGFWNAGISGHLGPLRPTEEAPNGWHYEITHASSDGSLAGGWYSPAVQATDEQGGLLWAQELGHVLIPELLEELGENLDWPKMRVYKVSPSGEYVLLGTGEVFSGTEPGSTSFERMALLRLRKK